MESNLIRLGRKEAFIFGSCIIAMKLLLYGSNNPGLFILFYFYL